MRIVGGQFRSRLLRTVPGYDVRPTPDRMRETLFNILAPDIEGSVFFDAYAGTGACGIEALSRGARKAIFVERNRAAHAVIQANLEKLDCADRAEVFFGKATQVIPRTDADIWFIDPPYALDEEYAMSMGLIARAGRGLAIVQHDRRFVLPDRFGKLGRYREVRQGDNVLSLYRASPRLLFAPDIG